MTQLHISLFSLVDFATGVPVIAYPMQMQATIPVYIEIKKYHIVQQGNTYIIRKLKWHERLLRFFKPHQGFEVQM